MTMLYPRMSIGAQRNLGAPFDSTEAPIAGLWATKRGQSGPKCTANPRAAPKVRLMTNLGLPTLKALADLFSPP